MRRLNREEWAARARVAYENPLPLAVRIENDTANLDFGYGIGHVAVASGRDATLVLLGEMRLLAGKDQGILVVNAGGGDWLVLWEGPLGKALMEQEASPIARRTPGEAEAYKQGYRAALQYVREKTVQALDGLDGVLLP